ncbi:MAG: hypothetical protein UU47_C0007G0012 [candidate division TM6 bacterium GW2011_GWE2_41_16]|nr:MAG: hypothetical protein UU47_C0007G0012 [candidate division TM6 bacterium GW2011_GWE2_41_16]
MLEINLTLIVQMVHFLIAYLIMRSLFVKDAVRIVINRELTREKQRELIKLEQEVIEKKHEEQHALSLYLKKEASIKMPEMISEEVQPLQIDELKERCLRAACDLDETGTIVESVAQKLTERIEHV